MILLQVNFHCNFTSIDQEKEMDRQDSDTRQKMWKMGRLKMPERRDQQIFPSLCPKVFVNNID